MYTKEQQEEMAAIVRREILIIDAYNAVQKTGQQKDCDLWSVLSTMTNEELTEVIKQNNNLNKTIYGTYI
jgi:uncharacterized protein YqeY